MTGVYDVLKNIKEKLLADGICNTVESGDLSEIALDKNILYPLAHVTLGNTRFPPNTIEFDVIVTCIDLLDVSKETATDQFRGNDNSQDALNTTAAILGRLVETIRRGETAQDGFHLIGVPGADPYYYEFKDNCMGYEMRLTVQLKNNMEAC